jgi:hypothetical protein
MLKMQRVAIWLIRGNSVRNDVGWSEEIEFGAR